MMAINPTTIMTLTLLIGVIALLFGPGIGIRITNTFRSYLRNRSIQEKEISEFLTHSALFLEGLPYFITHTWNWGPSVPNYGAGGSFPPDTIFVKKIMPSVCEPVHAFLALYIKHSKSQGKPRETLHQALNELKICESNFWNEVEIFAKKRWPLTWRIKTNKLRKLQIPIYEYDRIRNLKNEKI
ncbi:MAG: hypothetical protein V4552_00570 [Pseudomonadota bacterium]